MLPWKRYIYKLLQKRILTPDFEIFYEIIKNALILYAGNGLGIGIMTERAFHRITSEELMSLNRNKSSYVLLALSYLNDKEQAEDVFQESLLYLLENMSTIEVNNVRWYFSRVVLNKCLYHLRQTRNQARIRDNMKTSAIMAENISILSDIASEQTAFNADLSGCLEECRRILPKQTYDVFIDVKINGLSYKEIVEKYGISMRHVASEMQRALAVFRKVFKDYWFIFLLICGNLGGGSL